MTTTTTPPEPEALAPERKHKRSAPIRADGPRLGYRPAEVARLIGIGTTRTRELIRTGKIKSVRIGRSIVVTEESIRAFLASQEA